MSVKTVAIGSLGAIGLVVARGLKDRPGFRLAAVSARDTARARERLAGLGYDVPVVAPGELAAAADVVVECAPAAVFREIAEPAVRAGRTLILATVGQLLVNPDLEDMARESGARMQAITGAIAGLDAVRAAAIGGLESATLATRKAPKGLAGAPYLTARDYDPDAITEPTMVFSGDVRAAAEGFPANVNVGAALALAGCGPDRTTVEIWADPGATRTRHTITVTSASLTLTIDVEVMPSPDNPRSSTLTPYSILAALDALDSPLRIGS